MSHNFAHQVLQVGRRAAILARFRVLVSAHHKKAVQKVTTLAIEFYSPDDVRHVLYDSAYITELAQSIRTKVLSEDKAATEVVVASVASWVRGLVCVTFTFYRK